MTLEMLALSTSIDDSPCPLGIHGLSVVEFGAEFGVLVDDEEVVAAVGSSSTSNLEVDRAL